MSALALVGGAGADPNTVNSPWAGVGSLSVGGSKFTGTVIAPGYILTAAHVIAGQDPSNITFQLNAGTAQTFAAAQVFVNPLYTGTTSDNLPGDPTVHSDLAIIRVEGSEDFGTSGYGLYSGSIKGQNLTFVSYAGSDTVKRTGENIADVVFNSASGVAQSYLFDFDGPDLSTNRLGFNIPENGTLGVNREASFVSGDSGSSAFIHVNGQWQLAGINTFQAFYSEGPATSGAFGTGGGGVLLAPYASWIASVVTAPVPEPEPWLLLSTGIGLLGASFRYRRSTLLTPH
jgi:hypothetical protein